LGGHWAKHTLNTPHTPKTSEGAMTSDDEKRTQARERGRRYRAPRAKGLGRLQRQGTRAAARRGAIKSGMPHHGSRHHQRRVRCWLRQARRPDRGSGDVDQRGSAVAPQASLRLSVFTCELFEPGRRACPQWGECPKTRTNLDSAAAAIEHILSFQSFLVVFGPTAAGKPMQK
jgi:hypothetical protein